LLQFLGQEAAGLRHVSLPASFPAPTAADLARTAEIIADLGPMQALLIDGLAFGAMPSALVRSLRQPIVALCHHPLALETGVEPERAAALKASEREALALARAVIVTSPATKALLVREFAVPAGRITVALPGTDPAPRARGTGRPVALLAVGSVVPRKGYEVLVEALAGQTDLDWRLTIAGADDRSPPTTAAVARLVRERRLGHRISVVGAVAEAELERLYDAADLFVMPSLYEGYGMVLAEAMARGLAIVCTTGGAAAETAPDTAALKVPPGEAGPLAAALRRAIADAALRGEMARASWLAGQQLPRWEETARIVAGVLRRIAP
jgi:glycosyltransferase involved in cell wall biosynthesis